jgi:hypothetical protein
MERYLFSCAGRRVSEGVVEHHGGGSGGGERAVTWEEQVEQSREQNGRSRAGQRGQQTEEKDSRRCSASCRPTHRGSAADRRRRCSRPTRRRIL